MTIVLAIVLAIVLTVILTIVLTVVLAILTVLAIVLTVLRIVSSCICIDNRIYGHGVIAGVRQFPHGQSHRHRRICLLYRKV